MIAVITGEIINSTNVEPQHWQLKLQMLFESRLADASKWAIYKENYFLVEITSKEALELVILIKSLIKHIERLDVRMSIGLGKPGFTSDLVTESNGQAFTHSREAFETMRNKTLCIKTPSKDFDLYFNPMLNLVNFIASQWKPATAETIFYRLLNKDKMQKQIAELLNKDNTTVNKALKRGAYEQITEVLVVYKEKV
ncbi:SatD family protein [Myroides pelagicus]|uniref:Uncharacterized protein n=1 Tax=Myroides pelagicus TaxID=270914 RepID=A0A7K1GHL4_9FLAO|nr:SatD family protein [Myroides pelagicus]MTH28471.1 hypothetical protein [Myroides pelagicus]